MLTYTKIDLKNQKNLWRLHFGRRNPSGWLFLCFERPSGLKEQRIDTQMLKSLYLQTLLDVSPFPLMICMGNSTPFPYSSFSLLYRRARAAAKRGEGVTSYNRERERRVRMFSQFFISCNSQFSYTV